MIPHLNGVSPVRSYLGRKLALGQHWATTTPTLKDADAACAVRVVLVKTSFRTKIQIQNQNWTECQCSAAGFWKWGVVWRQSIDAVKSNTSPNRLQNRNIKCRRNIKWLPTTSKHRTCLHFDTRVATYRLLGDAAVPWQDS